MYRFQRLRALVNGHPQRLGVPRREQETEVERGVQLLRSHVPGQALRSLHPRLGDEDAVPRILLRDPAPPPVHLVHLVLVPVRVASGGRSRGGVLAGEIRHPGVLGQPVGHVDPEAVRATVQPEPQHRLEFGAYLLVGPVQVGLLGGEQVQVPLAAGPVGFGYPGPGRAAEVALPVVRWLGTVRAAAVPEQVARPLRAARLGGQRRPEPGVLVGGVIGHQVDEYPQPQPVRLGEQVIDVGQGAEGGIDGAVVRHVVARVGLRRGVERVEPQRVHAEVPQVAEPGPDSWQVPHPVAVGVGEAADVDLVGHRVAPPRHRCGPRGPAGSRLLVGPGCHRRCSFVRRHEVAAIS